MKINKKIKNSRFQKSIPKPIGICGVEQSHWQIPKLPDQVENQGSGFFFSFYMGGNSSPQKKMTFPSLSLWGFLPFLALNTALDYRRQRINGY